MKKRVIDERKLAFWLLCAVCVIYFGGLYQFYSIAYFVPDFRLYNSMAADNRKAADGFSSLFIWLASLCSIMPEFMNVMSLLIMSLAIFNILLFYHGMFWENMFKSALAMTLCMACGVWYYYYGKIFYDVPFSVFSYSLCLLAFMKVFHNRDHRQKAQKWWYALSFLLGFMMSWKPYNIFMLAGVGLLGLACDETRAGICVSIDGLKKLSVSGALLLLGYVTGNFNILMFPKETIIGIKAYPASYLFSEFMLDKHRIIWDHINDLPFSLSVFSVVLLIFAGIVWPIAIGRLRYLWISLFMFDALWLYISYFSPGYTWHGFGYGIYFVTYLLVLVRETKMEVLRRRGFQVILFWVILIQCAVNFGYYIPTQARWAGATRQAIAVLEEKETEIFDHVSRLVESFGGSTYMVENAIKRYRPYYNTVLDLRPVSVKQPYIVAENVAFVDPLQYRNYDGWMRIYTGGNYLYDPQNCDHIIFIIPNDFKCMGDVADIHLYDSKNLSEVIRENDYTIYVYSNL